VLNRVDNHGKVISDSFVGEHSRRACQRVEQQLGLATAEEQGRKQARREGPTNRQMAADTPRKVRIADWQRARHTVADALQPAAGSSGDFGELANKLLPRHIKQVVSAHQHKDGSIRYGVNYEYDGHRFKGGEVGQQFTAPKLLDGFAQVQVERQAIQVDQQVEARENERVRHQTQQALTGLINQKAFASHAEFRGQAAAQGYTFVTGPAGEAQLQHEASARQFDLARVQPGGATARPLWEQVEAVVLEKAAEERARQAARREEARCETEQALTQTRDSGLSRPEQFYYRLQRQPYDLVHDPQTRELTHVRHQKSGELFAYAEVQPGGPGVPPLAEQLTTAVRTEQQQVKAQQEVAAARAWAQGRARVENVTTQVRDAQQFFDRDELAAQLKRQGVTLLPPPAARLSQLFLLDATKQVFLEREVLRGGSLAEMLTEAAERRTTRRQEAWTQTSRDIAQTLYAPETPLTSLQDYKQQLEARGYKFRLQPGQAMEIEHLASGERFELREVQPGGLAAPSLANQVRDVLDRQKQQQGLPAQPTKDVEQVLEAENFTSWPQFKAQVQAKGYQFVTGLDGGDCLLHEQSRQLSPLAELRPNGWDLATQINEVIAAQSTKLVLGQIEVLASPKRSAAQRAADVQTRLEAVGVQVNITSSPAAGEEKGVVLTYTHAVLGAQLDEINRKLEAIQRSQGITVREQNQGFGQPPAEWPVRRGEHAQVTLVFNAAPGESARTLLQQTGATVREIPSAAAGPLVLEVDYHTERTDVKTLTKRLDQWQQEGPGIQLQETARARLSRGGQAPQEEITFQHEL
jgi:hypothetical protein